MSFDDELTEWVQENGSDPVDNPQENPLVNWKQNMDKYVNSSPEDEVDIEADDYYEAVICCKSCKETEHDIEMEHLTTNEIGTAYFWCPICGTVLESDYEAQDFTVDVKNIWKKPNSVTYTDY